MLASTGGCEHPMVDAVPSCQLIVRLAELRTREAHWLFPLATQWLCGRARAQPSYGGGTMSRRGPRLVQRSITLALVSGVLLLSNISGVRSAEPARELL